MRLIQDEESCDRVSSPSVRDLVRDYERAKAANDRDGMAQLAHMLAARGLHY